MVTALSNQPVPIGLGSIIKLCSKLNPDWEQEYVIGEDNDPKTSPPTIGQTSSWGRALEGKLPGDTAHCLARCEGKRAEELIPLWVMEVRPC